MNEERITTREAAHLVSKDHKTIQRHCKKGNIPSVIRGGMYWILPDELLTYYATNPRPGARKKVEQK